MHDPAFITVVLVVGLVLLVVFTGVPGRGRTVDKHDRVCRACRLAHPYFAQFCRKCGGKL